MDSVQDLDTRQQAAQDNPLCGNSMPVLALESRVQGTGGSVSN
jgi:hypothetical protein